MHGELGARPCLSGIRDIRELMERRPEPVSCETVYTGVAVPFHVLLDHRRDITDFHSRRDDRADILECFFRYAQKLQNILGDPADRYGETGIGIELAEDD